MNPRESALPRPVAMRLAAAEYDRCAELFRSLTPAQWARPTDCPAWDVRQMAAHMLGMAEMAASIRENLRQQRKANVVAEWADRHGKDFDLTLTGPAGGTWRAGANGPSWTLDAVDFCRAIARRPASTTVDDLLNTEVPY
jgi:Mycothiol maleylpyruvate isomerase N-terminal domain